MKTTKAYLLGLFGFIAMLAGCTSIPDATPVQPKSSEVIGTGDQQIAVVDELYNISVRETSKGSGMWILTTRIKFNTMSEELKVTDAPILMLLDENDQPIADGVFKLGSNAVDTQSKTLFQEFAAKTDGTEQSFSFYLNLADKDLIIDILKKTKSFVVEAVGEGIGSRRSSDAEDTVVEETVGSAGIEVILPNSLNGKVEVINVNGVNLDSNGYPEVDVTFKLVAKVSTSSLVGSTNQLWIAGIGQDANGVDVKDLLPNYKEWRTDDSDGTEFKSFLESEPGATITMTFTGENNVELFEKEQAKIDAGRAKTEAAASKVKKFKLKLNN